MFQEAARGKYRFPYRGQCSTGDLFDLPVKELDGVFKALNAQRKTQVEESLLDERTEEDEVLIAKIAIVKHIVAVKLAEKEAHENAALKAAHKQKLLGFISQKRDAALGEMSVEDLQKLIDEL